MGKVIDLCAGEQTRWKSRDAKQLCKVDDDVFLLIRTIKQIRKRMNNYPHIVSHQRCLRSISPNYVVPMAHRWECETLLSVAPVWGPDWTMVLLGDVYYSDELMDEIYTQRERFAWHFYGTAQEVFAMTFTCNPHIQQALFEVVDSACSRKCQAVMMDLYRHLLTKPPPEAGQGFAGDEDDVHYTYVNDNSSDFNTLTEYEIWKKKKQSSTHKPIKGV